MTKSTFVTICDITITGFIAYVTYQYFKQGYYLGVIAGSLIIVWNVYWIIRNAR